MVTLGAVAAVLFTVSLPHYRLRRFLGSYLTQVPFLPLLTMMYLTYEAVKAQRSTKRSDDGGTMVSFIAMYLSWEGDRACSASGQHWRFSFTAAGTQTATRLAPPLHGLRRCWKLARRRSERASHHAANTTAVVRRRYQFAVDQGDVAVSLLQHDYYLINCLDATP